jgi:mannose-6-phosphate isomerase class I
MLVPLSPAFQPYAWGDPSFIPELCGLPVTGKPVAEAWFGAHPSSPSVAGTPDGTLALDAWIALDADRVLGRDVRARFGGLPFLLKLLSAARPLSIQVHPSKAQAEAGFARENAAGIPLDAPQRSYRDDNHKPELIVALTPFDALCGFRPLDEISKSLNAVPEVSALLPKLEPTPEGLRAWTSAYFALPSAVLSPALSRWVERLRSVPDRGTEHPEHWVLAAHAEFSSDGAPDRGLVFVVLLNLLRLAPGEGLFLEAGVPHAYLRGAGLEVMSSSDNVLRGGLTPKHVDPAELARVVDFSGREPHLVRGEPGADVLERRYATSAAEFELSLLEVGPAPVERTARGPEILLVARADADGLVRIHDDQSEVVLHRGAACLVTDGTRHHASATAEATLCRVRVP